MNAAITAKYAVIFRAKVAQLDSEYQQTAAELRELALAEFGCAEFTSFTDSDAELAISWWHSLADIQRWREHGDHLLAQQQGYQRWYSEVSVEVVEVLRSYRRPE